MVCLNALDSCFVRSGVSYSMVGGVAARSGRGGPFGVAEQIGGRLVGFGVWGSEAMAMVDLPPWWLGVLALRA
jgi:hypothetical protein